MPALVAASGLIVRYICKLRGASQSILVQANDGLLYVVKFANNPQGRNVLFNEVMGTELYSACGLSVPVWKPFPITDEFIDHTPDCWIETVHSRLRPESGLGFGSRYLGAGTRCIELLTRSEIGRIINSNDFWLAWLLDICANHLDNRQAIFEEHIGRGLHAVFIDHGHMFSGPDGISTQTDFRFPACQDLRVYKQIPTRFRALMAQIVINLDSKRLWRIASQLPMEWQTETGLRNLAVCLNMLGSSKTVRSILDLIAGSSREERLNEGLHRQHERNEPNWILRAGIQAAG